MPLDLLFACDISSPPPELFYSVGSLVLRKVPGLAPLGDRSLRPPEVAFSLANCALPVIFCTC